MTNAFATAAFWLGLAVVATVIASYLRISMALVEICVGMAAGAACEYFLGGGLIGADAEWLKFLASSGAILLTFLAGAELEPDVMRAKWKEVSVVGIVGFLAPFAGCTILAKYVLGWSNHASLLAGVALSTTSMAVVYAVMLETGFNRTEFGKGILGACFVNDLGTVAALGLLFAPFTYRTLVFVMASTVALALLPRLSKRFTKKFGHRTAAIRAKWIMFTLFGLGSLALWSGSEAVLPAYVAGIVLAEFAAKDELWIKRMRTLCIGFLTPFYFLRAGSLVSLPAIIAAPLVFAALLAGKVASKIFGLYPFISLFRKETNERWYYTLMMSTGLTFGTISALYGYTHGIVSRDQYSFLVASVIASAVIPTIIANIAFIPYSLLPGTPEPTAEEIEEGPGNE